MLIQTPSGVLQGTFEPPKIEPSTACQKRFSSAHTAAVRWLRSRMSGAHYGITALPRYRVTALWAGHSVCITALWACLDACVIALWSLATNLFTFCYSVMNFE